MSITEQAGKAAQSTIDALKSTPVVLALVVFNVLFMGAMVFVSVKSNQHWDNEVQRWADLVARCTLKAEP
jgi:hypothetical protein